MAVLILLVYGGTKVILLFLRVEVFFACGWRRFLLVYGGIISVLLVYMIVLACVRGRSAVFFLSCIWSFFCLCTESFSCLWSHSCLYIWKCSCFGMEACLLVYGGFIAWILRPYCSRMDSSFALCYGGIFPCVSRHYFACLIRRLSCSYIYGSFLARICMEAFLFV